MKTILPQDQWPDHFNEEQYDLLVECAHSNDIKKWNAYKKKNVKSEVLLEGADLSGLDLSRADLRKAKLSKANLSSAQLSKTIFMAADLSGVVLDGAKLDGTDFQSAKLPNARITSVLGNDVKFRFSDLSGAAFHEARFDHSNFDRAKLADATFQASIIRDSNLSNTDLCGTKFVDAQIHGSKFCASVVDGETLVWNCAVDYDTDFTGVGLASARIEPQLLSRLETNIRRIWWTHWYADKNTKINKEWNRFKKTPLKDSLVLVRNLGTFIVLLIVRAFWWFTDYGSSTLRILSVFAATCLLFAGLYAGFPSLTGDETILSTSNVALRLIRALYFAIVTTTTVGFGDVSANPQSIAGHIIIIINVILGYTILAALVVRMGILFNTMPACECRPRKDDPIVSSNALKSE